MTPKNEDLKVYFEIENVFREYVHFDNPAYYHLASIYVLLTHTYDTFDQIPYLQVHGPKNSGKTRLGDIFSGLCSNPIGTSDITPAALCRVISNGGPNKTLVIDEADDLSTAKGFTVLERVLRSGYRRNGSITRCVNGEVVQYSTFCPKIIINIGGIIDSALNSRTIPIMMTRAETKPKKFIFAQAEVEFLRIKSLIRRFVEDDKNIITNRYHAFNGVEGIENREEEIWTPILVIADLFGVKSEMVSLARRIAIQRKHEELMGDRVGQVLEATQAYVADMEPLTGGGYDGYYVGEDLCRYIKDRWDIPNLRVKTVSGILNRKGIIRDMKRPRLQDTKSKGGSILRQKACYLFDKEMLSKQTKEYFTGGGSHGTAGV